MNSLVRRFIWGSSTSPVAWKDVCKPKIEGGLDLRDLAAWNKALLAKTLRNIHAKEDLLWIQWVIANILWSIVPHHCDSPTLKNVLAIGDKLLANCNGDKQAAIRLLEEWKTGKFASSAYEHFRTKFWHKAIWKNFVPPQFSITFWLALKGRLKIVDHINHTVVCKTCCFCNSAPKSHETPIFQMRSYVSSVEQSSNMAKAESKNDHHSECYQALQQREAGVFDCATSQTYCSSCHREYSVVCKELH